MLAADVSVHADGGGKRPAAPDPIFGFDEVMKLHAYLANQFQTHQSKLVRTGFINGLPGFRTLEADGELQTTTLDIEDGRITAIYVVRNPDKRKPCICPPRQPLVSLVGQRKSMHPFSPGSRKNCCDGEEGQNGPLPDTAQQRDSYSITSSARASNPGGISTIRSENRRHACSPLRTGGGTNHGTETSARFFSNLLGGMQHLLAGSPVPSSTS
jgi:hypothetical protein